MQELRTLLRQQFVSLYHLLELIVRSIRNPLI